MYCGAKQAPAPAGQVKASNRTMMGHPGMAEDLARAAREAGIEPGAAPGGPVPNPAGKSNPGVGAGAPPHGMGAPPAARPGPSSGPPPQQRAPGMGPGPGAPPQGFGPPPQGGPTPQGGPPPQGMGGPPPGFGAPPQGMGGPPPGMGPGPGGPPPQGFGGPGSGPHGPPGSGPHGGPGSGPNMGPGPGGPSPQGFAGPPPQQQGMGGPPPQGFAGPPPQQQQGMGGPPPAYGSPQQPYAGPQSAQAYVNQYNAADGRPETELVKPLAMPGYLASESEARTTGPNEPWAETIKTVLLVFGVLLVACFVAPWIVGGGTTTFSWTLIANAPGFAKVLPLLFAITGLTAVAIGAIPLKTTGRGAIAAALGLLPAVALVVKPFQWQMLLAAVGMATLVAGLFVRSQYTQANAGRIMTTIGVVIILALYLIPQGGQVPLVGMFKMLGAAPGKAKLIPILGAGAFAGLVPLALLVISLLVWLPGPGKAGAHVLAWVIIAYGLVTSILFWLLAGNLGDSLKAGLSTIFYVPIAQMAWLAFVGYGVATVVGKNLEHG